MQELTWNINAKIFIVRQSQTVFKLPRICMTYCSQMTFTMQEHIPQW